MRCNPATSYCSTDFFGSPDTGRECVDAGGTGECDGRCISLSGSGTNVCTQLCVIGQPGCGSGNGCVYTIGPSTSDGDLGACGQLCDDSSDCDNRNLDCVPFNNPDDPQFEFRRGFCGTGT